MSSTKAHKNSCVDEIGERDCVKTAAQWFNWDDAAANTEEDFWTKFDAACPITLPTKTTPTRRVVELSDRLLTLDPYLGETKYDANYVPGNMSEAEAAV